MVFEAHEEFKQRQADNIEYIHKQLEKAAQRAQRRQNGENFADDEDHISLRQVQKDFLLPPTSVSGWLEKDSIAPVKIEPSRFGGEDKNVRYYRRRDIEDLLLSEERLKFAKRVASKHILRNPKLSR